MTPALRTYHRRFWSVVTPVLLCLFVVAIRVIPIHADDPLDHFSEEPALPTLVLSGSNCGLKANLYTNDAHALQLEVLVSSPLSIPEALVYVEAAKPHTQGTRTLLGKLSSRGEYRFVMPSIPDISRISVEVYDPFYQRVHCSIRLTSEQ